MALAPVSSIQVGQSRYCTGTEDWLDHLPQRQSEQGMDLEDVKRDQQLPRNSSYGRDNNLSSPARECNETTLSLQEELSERLDVDQSQDQRAGSADGEVFGVPFGDFVSRKTQSHPNQLHLVEKPRQLVAIDLFGDARGKTGT